MASNKYATPDQYAAAFGALQLEGVPEKHIGLLEAHAAASASTVSWPALAPKVGYPDEEVVKLQYGKFARRVANALGIFSPPEHFWSNVLFYVTDHSGPNGRFRYKLLPGVAQGAVAAGLIPRVGTKSRRRAAATDRTAWLPEAQTNAAERKWINAFVASQTWIFAKSMPQWQHWYIIRMNYNWAYDYDRLAALIKKYGIEDRWGQKRWLYARFGNFKYWRLGDFINRAEPITSAEVRRRGKEWLDGRGMRVGPYGRPCKA